jgi:ankyrin repeat protein
MAAQKGHGDVVGLLLAVEGVQMKKPNKDEATPLWGAAFGGHGDVVGLLLAVEAFQARI